jgi:hypothetical protein
VTRQLLVALLQHRRQRGALAGACGSDHQNETAFFQHQGVQQGRHTECVQRGNDKGNAAKNGGYGATLFESAQTKTADTCQADAHVELARVVKFFQLCGAEHLGQELSGLGVGQWLVAELQDLPIDLDQDGCVGRQINVRRALF